MTPFFLKFKKLFVLVCFQKQGPIPTAAAAIAAGARARPSLLNIITGMIGDGNYLLRPEDGGEEMESLQNFELLQNFGGNFQSPLPPPSPNSFLSEKDSAEIKNYLRNFEDVLGEYLQELPHIADYNFPIHRLDFEVVKNVLEKVFREIQGKRVIVLLEVGYLLKHSFTGELRYFFASWNTLLGKRKFTLSASPKSLDAVIAAFRNFDFQGYLLNNRMSSPWLLVHPTNLHCIVQFLDNLQSIPDQKQS